MLNYKLNDNGSGNGGGTYTDKHRALAEQLLIDCMDIENDNDQIFKVEPHDEFWVLTDEEARDFLIYEIDVSFELPFQEFNLNDVANVLGNKVEEIKEYFLPDVLTGEVSFQYGNIDSDNLLKYLKDQHDVRTFIENYSDLLLKEERSGEILCNHQSHTKKNGYNIYYR